MSNEIEQLTLRTSIALPEWDLHGLVTGAVVGSQPERNSAIVTAIDSMRPGLCDPVSLDSLCTAVRNRLNDDSFEFDLILPDDDESPNARVAAVATWCQSFVEGFDTMNPAARVDLNDLNEPLNDLENIAALDVEFEYDESVDSELLELVEYTKVAVLLINVTILINNIEQGSSGGNDVGFVDP